ncbi:MAG TPA: TonB-dependent receptor [Desulfobacteraceae bacterium]|nr:TonB-dependent receptor [Desulfobacteraceae bacterium]
MKIQQHNPFLHGMAILSLALLLSGQAVAAEIGTGERPVAMDRVIVSVTRSSTPVEKIGGNSVTVIDRETIEASKATTVNELIKTAPGIDTTSNGGPGTATSVFLRGADAKNTLIMIDNIMVNDPSNAGRSASLSDINTDNIQRIEVIRGAMSVMYGSNATAGVINIITKEGQGRPSVTATAETGSYGTYRASAGAAGKADRLDYSLFASRTDIDGFSIADDDNDAIPHNGNTDEEDGFENTTLSGRAGVNLTETFKLSAIVRHIDATTDLDDAARGYTGDNFDPAWPNAANPSGPTGKQTESERLFGSLTAENSFASGFFTSKMSYNYSNQDRQSVDNDGSRLYDYDGTVEDVSWHGDVNFDAHTLSVGAEYVNESMESRSSGIGKAEADTRSAWIQDQLFMGDNLVVIAGIRYDDHETFGGKATYRLAPSYTLEPYSTTIKASLGTGFRSPSLYELYSSYGNAGLDPEKSTSWDAGIEKDFWNNEYSAGITYFKADYEERIEWVMTDLATFDGEYRNLAGTTETCGVEAFIQWTPSMDISWMMTYTYTDTKDPDGKRLARRPYHKVNASARYQFLEKGMLHGNVFWTGERKASMYARDQNGDAVDRLDDYFLVNLAASWDVNRHLQLYTKIDNLFDEYYEEAFGYATAGLSGYIGVKLTY